MAEEDRLYRIEGKVDKLVEAMTALTRFEEKIASQTDSIKRFAFRLDNLEGRVEGIENKTGVYDLWTGWASRIAMVVTTSIVLALLGLIFLK